MTTLVSIHSSLSTVSTLHTRHKSLPLTLPLTSHSRTLLSFYIHPESLLTPADLGRHTPPTFPSAKMSWSVLGVLVLLSPIALLAHADSFSATIDVKTPISPPIAPNFLGFSIEVNDFVRWVSPYPNPTTVSWLNLMQQLRTSGNDTIGPLWRVGGDSTDLSWYNPNGLPNPPGISYSIKDVDFYSYQKAMRATNGKLILGVNFRQPNNATWAVEHLQGVDRTIGWDLVEAVEIGNEPDLYYQNRIRASNYTYQQYRGEWQMYAEGIFKNVPNIPSNIFQGMAQLSHTRKHTDHTKPVHRSLSFSCGWISYVFVNHV